MPVQLQARTHLQATQNKQAFESKLQDSLSQKAINGREKLDQLRTYLEGKGNNAQIRVVNTTRDAELAFQFKSFGYQAYRRERTAGALTQLLIRAGVDHAKANEVVDRVLKTGDNYRTATKAMVLQILNDAEVQSAISQVPAGNPAMNPAPVMAMPHADPAPVAPPVAQHDVSAPALPLHQYLKPSDHDILNLIRGEFHNKHTVTVLSAKDPSELQNFRFKHVSGNEVEFHNFRSDPDAQIATHKGKVFGDDGLFPATDKKADAESPAPFKYLLQTIHNGQVNGFPMLVSRQQLLTDNKYADKTFQVLAALTSNKPVADLPVNPIKPLEPPAAAELDELASNPAQEPPPALAQDPKTIINSQSTTYTLDLFLQKQGFHMGAALGSGGYGSVKSLGSVPGSSQQVVKYFETNGELKPQPLTSVRTTRGASEAYAAYLLKSRDPGWVKPNITTPTHYVVGVPSAIQFGTSELKLVPAKDLKTTLRENTQQGRPVLKCYGLIMDKAPGEEVQKQLTTLAQNPNHQVKIVQSGLETLKTLSTRGFVHRDIKPANLLFDGQQLNFIDTGMLFKVRKTFADTSTGLQNLDPSDADRYRIAQLPTSTAGTTGYMHKDLETDGKRYIGTQADLHAFGLVTLQIQAPKAFNAVRYALMKAHPYQQYKPMSPEDFLTGLSLVIQQATPNGEIHKEAVALQNNMKDRNHLANLGYECLLKADTSIPNNSAARWANRQFADQQYAELLKHPALDVGNRVMA